MRTGRHGTSCGYVCHRLFGAFAAAALDWFATHTYLCGRRSLHQLADRLSSLPFHLRPHPWSTLRTRGSYPGILVRALTAAVISIGLRMRPNNSSKPMPLRGTA